MDELDWEKLWQQAEAETKAAQKPQKPQEPEKPEEPEPPEGPELKQEPEPKDPEPPKRPGRKKVLGWAIAAAAVLIAAAILAFALPSQPLDSPFGQEYGGVTPVYDTGWFDTSEYSLFLPIQLTEGQDLRLNYAITTSFYTGGEPVWKTVGTLEETKLTKETFDALFTREEGQWSGSGSAAKLRRQNANVWALTRADYVDTTIRPNIYLLQQKDGTLYLVFWENEAEVKEIITEENGVTTEGPTFEFTTDGTAVSETGTESVLAVVRLTQTAPQEDGGFASQPDGQETESTTPDQNGEGETAGTDTPETESPDPEPEPSEEEETEQDEYEGLWEYVQIDPSRRYEEVTLLMQVERSEEAEMTGGMEYDVEPFEVRLALPEGWSVQIGTVPKTAGLYSSTTSVYTVYNGQGEPVGQIGFAALAMDPGGSHLSGCGVLNSGSTYSFNLSYQYVVGRAWDTGVALRTTVQYSATHAENILGRKEVVRNWGFVICEEEIGAFVAMELTADSIDEADAAAITQSMVMISGTTSGEE